MGIDDEGTLQIAAEYAERAASVAGSLKPGTYEAVQALALVSIANSLAVIARRSQG